MQPKCRALKCYAQTIMNLPASPPPAAAGNVKQGVIHKPLGQDEVGGWLIKCPQLSTQGSR